MDARLAAGEDPSAVLGEWGRIPWSNLLWLEWSTTLELCWRYEVPGHGSHSASFVVKSGAERELLAQVVADNSGMSRSHRRRSTMESVRGPLLCAAGGFVLGGILWWRVGAEVSGGGRTAARAALVTTLANAIGYTGIATLTLLVVVCAAIVAAMRVRNPPSVARLERADAG